MKFLPFLLIAFLLVACGGNPEPMPIPVAAAPADTPAPTATTAPTNTPTPEPTATPTAIPTNTPTPEPTATSTPLPTDTPTPSPTPPPSASVTSDSINLRGGPGTVYPVVGKANKGEALLVISRTEDGSWLQVEMAGAKQAWVSAKLVTLSTPVESLAVAAEIPPTPVQPIAVNAGNILKNVRLISDDNAEGPARRSFAAGVTTIWLGYEIDGTKLQNSDVAILNLINAAGETILSFPIVGPENRLHLPKGSMITFGPFGLPRYVAVPVQFDDGHPFPKGAYRAELVLNGRVTGVIPWTVG